jgi:hypothetical protein
MAQTNALDRNQQAYSADKAKAREVRVADLWRFVLKHPMGREFVWDVLLGDLNYDRPIQGFDPGLLQQQVAEHNLAVTWLNTQVRRNRDLYLQMLTEASKREDEERQEDETMRAKWARADEEHDA